MKRHIKTFRKENKKKGFVCQARINFFSHDRSFAIDLGIC
jgi:hypothetical protein